MSQAADGIDLPTSVAYLLKQAASALRAAMEEVLRPLGMTVTHYACLELLSQRPGLSNSDLARGAFVTRQSMNVLLRTLQQEGLITRAVEAPVGRALPVQMTPVGRRQLAKATVAVRSVEQRMLSRLDEHDELEARRILHNLVAALTDPSNGD